MSAAASSVAPSGAVGHAAVEGASVAPAVRASVAPSVAPFLWGCHSSTVGEASMKNRLSSACHWAAESAYPLPAVAVVAALVVSALLLLFFPSVAAVLVETVDCRLIAAGEGG